MYKTQTRHPPSLHELRLPVLSYLEIQNPGAFQYLTCKVRGPLSTGRPLTRILVTIPAPSVV
jgi:hypothetical protein